MALPYGITYQQIGIVLLVIAVLWRLEQLPAVIAKELDRYIPQQIASMIKGK